MRKIKLKTHKRLFLRLSSFRACPRRFMIIYLFLLSFNSYAQSSQAYLIPKQIYVGDRAALVVPLPASIKNSDDIILTKDIFFPDEEYFPSDENIDFHRIILEQRTSGSRLIIEFTAFFPGNLKLPVIKIGGEYFSGLSVTVNSTIEGTQDRVLSGAASTLAIPGTALMLYGSIAALVFAVLLAILFIVKGRVLLLKLKEKWKRCRLFTVMRNTEKRLRRAVIKGGDKRYILDKLSEETRNFLSVLTDINCRAMTAEEFKKLTLNNQPAEEEMSLGNFFRSCDEYRFSGSDAESGNILHLLDDLIKIIDITEKPAEDQSEAGAA